MSDKKKLTGHIITHNHWDRDWVLTEKHTKPMAVEFFNNLFDMMAEEKEFKMILDGQSGLIDDFLEDLTDKKMKKAEKELEKYISQGRLAAGPNYIQPDYVLISAEAHVRNLLIGHKVAEKYGKVLKTGWLVDTFGHMSQSPQLLNQFGIKGIFIARGLPIPPEDIMSEFYWEGADGSELLSVYTMNTSRNAMNLAQMPEIAENRIDIEMEKLEPLCITPHIPLFNGFEQDPIIDDIYPIMREINSKGKDYELVQTNPDEFFEIIANDLKGKKVPRTKGFLYSGIYMPLLHGTLSTRMQLKLRNDICEKLNEKWAEPLSALAWYHGDKYPGEELEKSWKMILQNDHHDDICGCCSDEVDIDMNKRYDKSEKISNSIIEDKMLRVAGNVDTSKAPNDSPAIVVFNPANYDRSDVVTAVLEIPKKQEPSKLIDIEGNAIPFQVMSKKGKKQEIAFKPELPANGYATFYLAPEKSVNNADYGLNADVLNRTAENEHMKIKVNDNGTVDVTYKKTGKTYKECGALVDGGDIGDLYDYSYPKNEKLVSSKEFKANIILETAGPLVARFRVEQTLKVPKELTKDRSGRSEELTEIPVVSYIDLKAGSSRLEWTTSLTNTAKNHRIRAHFPTGVKSEVSYAGESFDVNEFTFEGELWGIELPDRLQGLVVPGRDTVPIRSYPFHGFCDYNDGKTGVGAIAKGIREYEITKDEREIALTLLRSVGWMTHLDILTRNGDVGWEIYTPGAQCFDTYTFRYGMVPHEGSWMDGKLHVESELFNEPVKVVETNSHKGELPEAFSFVRITPQDKLVQSAIKRSEDGKALVVRCYNPTDESITGQVELEANVKSAMRSNAAEDITDEMLESKDGAYTFTAGPRKIVSFRFELEHDKMMKDLPGKDIVKATRECKPHLKRKDEALDVELPPVVTKEDIESEEKRLEKIKKEYKEMSKQAEKLQKQIKENKEAVDHDLLIEHATLNHKVALHRRYIDEALFSVLLTKRRYYEETVKDKKELKKLMDQTWKEIGETDLPGLRIVGRLHEYVRQFYVSLKASALGDKSLLSKVVTDAAMSNTAEESLEARKNKGKK